MGIGSRIRGIRGGLSRQKFGSMIGAGKSSIQNYETKDKVPKGNILQNICTVFNVNTTWLLTGQSQPPIKDRKVDQVGIHQVVDDEGLWGRTRRHQVEGSEVDVTLFEPKDGAEMEAVGGLGQSVELLANILSSGNQVMIRAILSNLQAFSNAVDSQYRAEERILKLEEECEKFEKRVAALEEKHKPEHPEPHADTVLKQSAAT